jgi:putative transposase
VKFCFIKAEAANYPVRILCRVMKVGKSAFYACKMRPGQLISAQELELHRQAKSLFKASRDSLGSRELSKKLNEEGFNISRYLTRKLMKKLKLKVEQRLAYKVNTAIRWRIIC